MQTDPPIDTFAFSGTTLLARGPRADVAAALRRHLDATPTAVVLAFDDETGRVVDLDLRGTPEAVAARYAAPPAERATTGHETDTHRGPGRPRLGVTPREVTLLPRHWEWLGAQPGGASAVLRRLVEAAMSDPVRQQAGRVRERREVAYRVMETLAGDLPGFEAASRALFAGRRGELTVAAAAWPPDVLTTVLRLAGEGLDAA
ncbi:DUF2239 family protein [Myxococcota bacterium]|nr:DUF2239 family protein [Myxococcota bacterium]